MPLTTVFCIIGAASISAFPLMSGFISKSLIVSAAAEGHYTLTFLVLLFASAGVFHHSGIKIPYFAFFSHDSGIRVKEAPLHMLVAMGITAFLCVFLGVYPRLLYEFLPFPVDYHPYTPAHVITQLQLLLFAAVCFGILNLVRLYPPELRSANLDTDWVYRKLLPGAVPAVATVVERVRSRALGWIESNLMAFLQGVYRHHGPRGIFARSLETGSSVLWVALLLVAVLIFYYL